MKKSTYKIVVKGQIIGRCAADIHSATEWMQTNSGIEWTGSGDWLRVGSGYIFQEAGLPMYAFLEE